MGQGGGKATLFHEELVHGTFTTFRLEKSKEGEGGGGFYEELVHGTFTTFRLEKSKEGEEGEGRREKGEGGRTCSCAALIRISSRRMGPVSTSPDR